MKRIGDVLSENRGIGPGFDFLRIALATAIVLSFTAIIGNVGIKIPDAGQS